MSFRTRLLLLGMAVGCGSEASSIAFDGGTEAPPPDAPEPDSSPPLDAGVILIDAGVPPIDARIAPTCQVEVLSHTLTAATIAWHVSCPSGGEAVALPQVGAGTHWGENDSLIVSCGDVHTSTLDLPTGFGDLIVWGRVDTITWPYEMDDAIAFCDTPGAPQ